MGRLHQPPTMWGSKPFPEGGREECKIQKMEASCAVLPSDVFYCCTHKLAESALTVTSLHEIKLAKITAWLGDRPGPTLTRTLLEPTAAEGRVTVPGHGQHAPVHATSLCTQAVLITLGMLLTTIKKKTWSREGDDQKARGAGER